jgi:hypothetical protein
VSWVSGPRRMRTTIAALVALCSNGRHGTRRPAPLRRFVPMCVGSLPAGSNFIGIPDLISKDWTSRGRCATFSPRRWGEFSSLERRERSDPTPQSLLARIRRSYGERSRFGKASPRAGDSQAGSVGRFARARLNKSAEPPRRVSPLCGNTVGHPASEPSPSWTSSFLSREPGKRRSTVRLRGNKRGKPSRFARTGTDERPPV